MTTLALLRAGLGDGTVTVAAHLSAETRAVGLTYDQLSAGRAVLGMLGLICLAFFAFRALSAWRARRRARD